MKTGRLVSIAVATLLLASSTCLRAAEQTVTLTIKANGEVVPPPASATIVIDGHEHPVAIEAGKFVVPTEVERGEYATFLIDVGKNRIRVAGLHRVKFEMEYWTLLLADRRHEDRYWRDVPFWCSVRHSCILLLDSRQWEGTVAEVPHRRTKLK